MRVIFTITGIENLDSYIYEFIEETKKYLEESSKKFIAKIMRVDKILKGMKFEYESDKKRLIVYLPVKNSPISEQYVLIMKENLENYLQLKTGEMPLIEYRIED